MASTKEILNIKAIKQHVAKHYSIDVKTLENGTHWFPEGEARFVCFELLNTLIFSHLPENYRLAQIGLFIGGKNRNTVRHGIKKIHHWLPTDRRFKATYQEIKSFVESNILDYENSNN